LAVNKQLQLDSTEESSNILSAPAHVLDQNGRQGLLQDSLSVTKHQTPHPVVKEHLDQMLPMPRGVSGPIRHISSPMALSLNPSDIVSSDSEPIDAEDIRRLTKRATNQPDPLRQKQQEVEHLYFRSEQQLVPQYERMVTNPPKRIREKGLLDLVAAIRLESKDPRRRNSHAFEIDEK
jgi:hypothetical protein